MVGQEWRNSGSYDPTEDTVSEHSSVAGSSLEGNEGLARWHFALGPGIGDEEPGCRC